MPEKQISSFHEPSFNLGIYWQINNKIKISSHKNKKLFKSAHWIRREKF